MCYYVSLTQRKIDIEQRFGVIFSRPDFYQPFYSASAFTYPEMPVISNEHLDSIDFYFWGLIPSWIEDTETAESIRKRTLNARAETIFTKPSFRYSVLSKRCLVLADGFFEWRHETNKAYPYHIRLKNGKPFSIAGIWDVWITPDTQQKVRTFSVITTSANVLLAQVHNTKKRMPVILPEAIENKWLDNNLGKDSIQTMLKPYDSAEMEAYPVPKIVNKLGYNTTNRDVLNHITYPELPDLVAQHGDKQE